MNQPRARHLRTAWSAVGALGSLGLMLLKGCNAPIFSEFEISKEALTL